MKIQLFYSNWALMLFILYKMNIIQTSPIVSLYLSAIGFILLYTYHLLHGVRPGMVFLVLMILLHILPLLFINIPPDLTDSLILFVVTFSVYYSYLRRSQLSLLYVYNTLLRRY